MQLSMNVNTIPEAQAQPAAATKVVLAGKLFDPYTLELLENQAITISSDSGLILDVTSFSNIGSDFVGDVIDLRNSTVLPGFVDTHVHCKRISFISDTVPPSQTADLKVFLHPYAETSWEDQLTKESITERTIRATVHARHTLMAGFTAVRYV
jgi:cytosine/adenosine deaminase-related metal-dependent hydrolase